jgi:multidrug efflux pump subunit AcrA (membrane-fusion protein)
MLVLVNVAPAGGHVKKGDIIAEFDRTSQLNRLDDYKDSVIQQDANLKKMKSDQAVARESHEQQIRSAKADLDKAELDLKTAPVRSAIESETLKLAVEEAQAHYKQIFSEAKLFDESQRAARRAAEIDRDQAKIELQRAERNIERMVVRAPMNGVVVMQSIFRGGDFGQVQKGDQLYPGMMFMQVIDPTSMVLGAVVNQVDAEAIRLGMKAMVRLDAYPGLVLSAHVIGIGAMTKPGVWRPTYMREIPVRLKLDAVDGRVIPDISASADIQLSIEKQVNVAPLSAVFYDRPGGKPFVFLRSAAGWERRDVELGLTNNVAVVVRSGAASGDVLAAEKP